MLKILIGIIVQVFHANNFFKFRPILYRFNGRILRFSMGKKVFVCVSVF